MPLWRIHRHIGMGGDKMIAAVAGSDIEFEKGDEIREKEKELYGELIEEVEPMAGAREFVFELKERGYRVVLASSAKAEEVDHYLDLLDVREVVDGWTTSADVEATKPDPDLIKAALAVVEGAPAVMIGDSVYDCEAAKRAGVETLAVLTGGFSEQELLESGAKVVVESITELGGHLPAVR